MNTTVRRVAAVLATGALVATGVALGASAANAAQITGNIKLFAAGSSVGTNAAKQITSGSSTSNPMYSGITIDAACPAGFRDGTNIFVFQGGTNHGSIALTNSVDNDGVYGTNGLKASDTSIAMDESSTAPAQNPYVDNNKALDSISSPLSNGAFELRYYCFADHTLPDFDGDKYFSLALNYNASAHTWNVPAPLASTTVSLTAASNADSTATLTATVKKASGATATDASGTVSFAEGSTTLGTGTVTNGVATFTTAALSGGFHQFTATYAGDTSYAASSASGPASVTIAGSNGSPAASTTTVDIPAGVGSITLSGVPTAVDLGTASLSGGKLVASNTTAFSGITVTDTRQLDAPSWTLTGQVSDFTSGTHTLLGKYLGWVPSVTSGPGAAGAVVASAASSSDTGLKDLRTLATGSVTDGQPVTTVKADLSLSAPANTPSGHYTATLTVTLS